MGTVETDDPNIAVWSGPAAVLPLLDAAPDGMLLTNADGAILLVNRQLEAMFGYERHELLGTSVERLLPDRFRDGHAAHRHDYHQNPRPRAMGSGLDLWARRADGSEFPVEISLSPVTEGDDVVYFASIRDVSDRVELDRQLARLNVLEDRDRIARDLHDLVIQRLFATGLGLQSLAARVEARPIRDRLEATVTELDTIIRELRSTIFGLAQDDQAASIREQITEAALSHTEALGFSPRVTFQGDMEGLPLGVVEQLIPTLHEALSNVVRHAAATSVRISVELTADQVIVQIFDDGIGISSEPVQGNGLTNLARRAHRVGGTCEVKRQVEGPGTVVTWTAPR
jgi:PAS domain S-box-containing protein